MSWESFAIWPGRIAMVSLLGFACGVLLIRMAVYRPGFLLFGLGALLSAIALTGFLVLLFTGHVPSRPGTWLLLMACILPVAQFAYLVSIRNDFPRIHDISTDLIDPPVFEHARDLRPAGSNSLEVDPDALRKQQNAYADIQSIITTAGTTAAYEKAGRIAGHMGWNIVHSDPPGNRIEAVDSTPLMNFKDDIAIRITELPDHTRVDLRSVSRVGVGDLGANARRIREFMQRWQETR